LDKDAVFDAVNRAKKTYADRLTVLLGVELGQAHHYPEQARALLDRYPYDIVLGSLHNLRSQQDFYYMDYSAPTDAQIADLFDRALTEMTELLDFDGIIWVRPEQWQYPVIEFIHGQVPQVVINRTIPGEVCVSTDHRGAYYEITRERLDKLPESQVFLLQSCDATDPTTYREAGFIDACRAAQRFYEVVPLPEEFDSKLAKLESLERIPGKPLLLISTTINNTGAVMWYARKHNLQWNKDIFYSDFDNDLAQHIWGVKVTSYIQDNEALFSGAVLELEGLLAGKTSGRLHTLIFPRRCNGNT
jgi:DNA-binding LacI/PurR family transcriptional regulator